MRLESLLHGILMRLFQILTCEKVEQLSYDFLENRLGKIRMAQIRVHLATCPQCLRFMKSYRKTRELGLHLPRPELAPEFKDAMFRYLISQRTP